MVSWGVNIQQDLVKKSIEIFYSDHEIFLAIAHNFLTKKHNNSYMKETRVSLPSVYRSFKESSRNLSKFYAPLR